jgi:hypothetical protein
MRILAIDWSKSPKLYFLEMARWHGLANLFLAQILLKPGMSKFRL